MTTTMQPATIDTSRGANRQPVDLLFKLAYEPDCPLPWMVYGWDEDHGWIWDPGIHWAFDHFGEAVEHLMYDRNGLLWGL